MTGQVNCQSKYVQIYYIVMRLSSQFSDIRYMRYRDSGRFLEIAEARSHSKNLWVTTCQVTQETSTMKLGTSPMHWLGACEESNNDRKSASF